MREQCTQCDGQRNKFLDEPCQTCGNDGWVDDDIDGGTMTCPECDGEAGQICTDCNGEGYYD